MSLSLALLAVSGCAGEVETGKARPGSTQLQLPGGDRVHPEDWPDACRFLTDLEITALLPNAETVTRRPSRVTLLDPDFLNEDNLTGDAPRGSCEYEVDHGGDNYVTITVTIEAVGPPADVRAMFEQAHAEAIERKTQYDTIKTAQIEGAAGCFWHSRMDYPSITCHHGRLAFQVNTMTNADLPDVPGDERNRTLAHRLQPEIVKTIVAKLQVLRQKDR